MKREDFEKIIENEKQQLCNLWRVTICTIQNQLEEFLKGSK